MTEIEPTSMPELVTRPNVDIVAAGTWKLSTGEATFTPGDLAAAIDAQQCPAIGSPVIKLGHVDPRFDGEPTVGYVSGMRLTAGGSKITGDLAGIPAWLDAVLASAYPNRSMEGFHNFTCSVGHVHPFVITGLALLGVTPPGVGVLSSLKDVAALYGVAAADRTYGHGDRWRLSLPEQSEILERGGTMPEPVMAAGVSVEDVRRAYYESASTPMTSWIAEMQLDPPQLIVSDDATGDLYRVPLTIDGSSITFGDPVKVQVEYQDAPDEEEPAKKAASRVAAKWVSAAESRPAADGEHDQDSAATSGASMNPTTAQAADQEVAGMQVTLTDAEAAELRAALGKGPDDELTGVEVLAALKARDDKAAQVSAAAEADKGMVRVDATQWDAIQAAAKRGEEARTKQLADHRDAVIKAAIGAGKFSPARREHWELLWSKDPEGTEQDIASLAAGLIPLRDIGQGGGEPQTAEDAEYAALFGQPASN